ncbi:unnamed protein product, partial [Didymodactylos carnosus]
KIKNKKSSKYKPRPNQAAVSCVQNVAMLQHEIINSGTTTTTLREFNDIQAEIESPSAQNRPPFIIYLFVMISTNCRDLHLSDIEDNKEDITLIWLDKNIDDSDDSRNMQILLCELNTCHVLREMQSFSTIDSIFIFCVDGKNQYMSLLNDCTKLLDIFTRKDSLVEAIRNTIRLISRQTLAFSLFDHQQQKSTRNLAKDSASFLWYQLLVDVLKQLPKNEHAKQDMIDTCFDYYRTNR